VKEGASGSPGFIYYIVGKDFEAVAVVSFVIAY
jgi:hypothetical protein